jgi:hypothetical protein
MDAMTPAREHRDRPRRLTVNLSPPVAAALAEEAAGLGRAPAVLVREFTEAALLAIRRRPQEVGS